MTVSQNVVSVKFIRGDVSFNNKVLLKIDYDDSSFLSVAITEIIPEHFLGPDFAIRMADIRWISGV